MPLDPSDVKLLWDMLDAARRASSYVQGLTFDQFAQDDRTQGAVERRVEVIGEAARQVSETARAALPAIAWRAIVGTRHILAHDYGTIDQSQMWRIVTVHVPALIRELERALADHPTPPDALKNLGTP